uniref:Alanine and arginine rich domain containing protein n=1 Tax=Catagonus wagneri TaxID=51154 RepID=A0A8C3WIC4_9CETA
MASGDSCRHRERTSRGSHGLLFGAELWPSALRPARGFPGGRKSVASQEQPPAASPLLEDLRRRLVRAFQRAVPRGGSRRSREAAAAQEERSRARVESALAGLRAELLEMHFQNRQLARTLLDLDMKMQQLKKEYELEMASESQSSEDNDMNPE